MRLDIFQIKSERNFTGGQQKSEKEPIKLQKLRDFYKKYFILLIFSKNKLLHNFPSLEKCQTIVSLTVLRLKDFDIIIILNSWQQF